MFSQLTKWIDLLKASSIQLLSIATAAGAFLLLHRFGIIRLPEIWFLTATALLLVSLALGLGGTLASGAQTLGVGDQFLGWRHRRSEAEAVRKYIPHMTDKEKEILGYLLERNQKMLVATSSGGDANTLVARGIIVNAVRPGQAYTHQNVPYEIPDHIWNVLLDHRDAFPTGISDEDGHPWRVHWMVGE